ncbi:putative 2-phosphosulfolactate phosphatase [Pseudobythopirellula maris]|uniref:Probable 2-phosphosulfolactate phosphatase n=1 Tax=Pseudobythopirellula maris TaxID=2527991 RepID=A0A5C5ZJJ2_9BACT|nr:2-phosphosulfolactate phosphatase [Pseudobythopirellula maris]TWT87416.1 putative 2-phosphosulfolactate phosphatase [Pseudobythopirellula maris]
MPKKLEAHYLPQFVREEDLVGSVVVVIDLLRASTTIATALAAGAAEVRPYLEVGDVVRAAEQLSGESESPLMLAGERGCQRIEGFHLGNSPSEYTAERVFGARLLFTTTNGTRALQHARLAERVAVGCVANLTALAESLQGAGSVALLCAGTNAHVSREDRLAAGAIAHRLEELEGEPRERSEPADAVLREWQELLTTARALGRSASEQLAVELRDTPGGKNLLKVGHDDDLIHCAQVDTLSVVPGFDPKSGRITLA